MKTLDNIDYIEQELAEVRGKLHKSFVILDFLAQLPPKFEDIDQIHQRLHEQLEAIKTNREELLQVKTAFSQRLTKIEEVIESEWKKSKGKSVHLQDELGSADVHLSNYNAVAKQICDLRKEVADRLTSYWREWASDKAAQAFLGEIIDAKLGAELKDFFQELDEAGFNIQNLKKQATLEAELRLTQSSLHDVKRQLQALRNFTNITGLTVATSLGLVIFQLLNHMR